MRCCSSRHWLTMLPSPFGLPILSVYVQPPSFDPASYSELQLFPPGAAFAPKAQLLRCRKNPEGKSCLSSFPAHFLVVDVSAPAIGQTSGRWGRSKYSHSELRWQIQANQLTYAGASELQPSGVVFARYEAVAMKAHRLNEGLREDMAYCGDDPQLGVGWGREPGAVQGTAPLRTRPSLQAVDEAGNVAGAEAVIDVYHRDIAGTTDRKSTRLNSSHLGISY